MSERYLELAQHIATWSKDPNAQVGAVLTDSRRGLTAVGYNGFPIGIEDSIERLKNKKLKNQMVVHGEENVVVLAGDRAKGGTLYVVGKPVCSRCAGLIIQARVKRVIAALPKEGTDSHWDEVGLIAVQMFQEAKIAFENSDLEDPPEIRRLRFPAA